MAVKLIASYSKRLGLPGFSSHQFSVSVETELVGVTDVSGECTRLYQTLQSSVDQEIQSTGFVPSEAYGIEAQSAGDEDGWLCSRKQRELIESLVGEHQLDKTQIEKLATERFGKGVKALNKLEASGLIVELFERVNGKPPENPLEFNRSAVRRKIYGRKRNYVS